MSARLRNGVRNGPGEGGIEMTRRRGVSCCLVGVVLPSVLLFAAFVVLRGTHAYRVRVHMAPYRALVAQRATRSAVLRRFGNPCEVIRDNRTLREWAENYPLRPSTALVVESEVLVYNLGPYSEFDIDPDIVYVFINRHGVVARVARGVDT